MVENKSERIGEKNQEKKSKETKSRKIKEG